VCDVCVFCVAWYVFFCVLVCGYGVFALSCLAELCVGLCGFCVCVVCFWSLCALICVFCVCMCCSVLCILCLVCLNRNMWHNFCISRLSVYLPGSFGDTAPRRDSFASQFKQQNHMKRMCPGQCYIASKHYILCTS